MAIESSMNYLLKIRNNLTCLYLEDQKDLETENLHLILEKNSLRENSGFFIAEYININMMKSGTKTQKKYFESFIKHIQKFTPFQERTISIIEEYKISTPLKHVVNFPDFNEESFLYERKVSGKKIVNDPIQPTTLCFKIGEGIEAKSIFMVLEFILENKFSAKI